MARPTKKRRRELREENRQRGWLDSARGPMINPFTGEHFRQTGYTTLFLAHQTLDDEAGRDGGVRVSIYRCMHLDNVTHTYFAYRRWGSHEGHLYSDRHWANRRDQCHQSHWCLIPEAMAVRATRRYSMNPEFAF